MVLIFDTESIRLITLFENLTGTNVKDCLIDNSINTVYFVVEEGKVGMAIGKNGDSVKNVENLIKKNIKIFEFSNNLNDFIKKIIPQGIGIKVINEDKIMVEVKVDKKDKAMVIGRDGKNLKLYKELLGRNYGVNEVIIK
jgi:N utilization substance protein A